jgi:hypothetical protein
VPSGETLDLTVGKYLPLAPSFSQPTPPLSPHPRAYRRPTLASAPVSPLMDARRRLLRGGLSHGEQRGGGWDKAAGGGNPGGERTAPDVMAMVARRLWHISSCRGDARREAGGSAAMGREKARCRVKSQDKEGREGKEEGSRTGRRPPSPREGGTPLREQVCHRAD